MAVAEVQAVLSPPAELDNRFRDALLALAKGGADSRLESGVVSSLAEDVPELRCRSW